MRVVVLEAGGDAARRRRPAAGGLRRSRLPSASPRKIRPCAGTSSCSTTPTRRSSAAIRKLHAERDGVFYPRAGTLGGCTAHNAMILMRAARCRLGRHRGADRRRIVARRPHAALLPAARGMPLSAGLALACRGSGSTRPAMAGTAGCTTERALPRCRCSATASCSSHRVLAKALGAMPTHARCTARRARCEPSGAWCESRLDPNDRRHAARQCRWALLHAAQHRSAPAGGNARTAARCRGAPSGSAAHRAAMRWRRACCSTPTIAPPASSI